MTSSAEKADCRSVSHRSSPNDFDVGTEFAAGLRMGDSSNGVFIIKPKHRTPLAKRNLFIRNQIWVLRIFGCRKLTANFPTLWRVQPGCCAVSLGSLSNLQSISTYWPPRFYHKTVQICLRTKWVVTNELKEVVIVACSAFQRSVHVTCRAERNRRNFHRPPSGR
jgi:hypothetical protein